MTSTAASAAGDADHIMDEARKAYLAGYLSGRDVLLMAQSHDTCRELSQRIREDLVHLGVVSDGPSAALRDGARASVGDLIITRKNDHGLGVANGDTWRVEAVDGDRITMRQMVDADRETGERRYAETLSSTAPGEPQRTWRTPSTGPPTGPASGPRLCDHRALRAGPDGGRGHRADHRHRNPRMGVCRRCPAAGTATTPM